MQTLSLSFSIFRGLYISMKSITSTSLESLIAAWEGDGCMKDTDHPMRHPRVHLSDRASARRTRGCARPNGQYGRGTAPSWAGATPLCCHGNRGGRSSPTNGSRHQCATVGIENPGGAGEEGKNFPLQLRFQRFLHLALSVGLRNMGT